MADKINIHSKYDLKDNYDPSESEDEYNPQEKELLNKVRRQNQLSSEEDEEVYGFSESDEDKDDLADSDVEGQEASEDDGPDAKAWGKKKRAFYSTDYVDEDYGGFGKDEEAATLEEREALSLQRKLAEQLGDEDFSLEIFSAKSVDVKKDVESEIVIKSDLSQMSKRQKLQLLEKESPEFSGLVSDFKEKLFVAKDVLKPILTLSKKGKLPVCMAIDFVKIYYELVLNYCTNISFYLLLKTKKTTIQNHPVTKRLYQHKQMLNQIEPVFAESIKPQLDKILSTVANNRSYTIVVEDVKSNVTHKKSKSYSKKLKLLNSLSKSSEDVDEVDDFGEDDDENGDDNESETKYVEESDDIHDNIVERSDEDIPDENVPVIDDIVIDESGEKRAITYQMAKNKGLTPRRKKEQRNPRVKHRNKYRKAKIRRKGAVREPRTETTRYAGEVSGIKTNIKKSIKIK